jgi:hypothetical protein
MRSQFSGHYPLTSEEEERIWESAIIVLDTNALLNLYRYSPEARTRFIEVLTSASDRLWCPYQVASEFHERRLDIIRAQNNLSTEIFSVLDKALSQASAKLREHQKNAFFDVVSIESKMTTFFTNLKGDLESEYKKRFDKYGLSPQSDSVLIKVDQLYSGKVGTAFSDADLAALYQEGEKRYGNSIPPGYMDARKGDMRMYGDFLIWKEILKHSAEMNVDIILVTDDSKEDWWWKSQGKTLGPRPELRQEFLNHAGRIFYSYGSARFIEEVGSRGDVKVESILLDEVKKTSTRAASEEANKYRSPAEIKATKIGRGREISERFLRLRSAEKDLISLQDGLAAIESEIDLAELRIIEADIDQRKQRDNFNQIVLLAGGAKTKNSPLFVKEKENFDLKIKLLDFEKAQTASQLADLRADYDTLSARIGSIRRQISKEGSHHLLSAQTAWPDMSNMVTEED